MTNMFTLSEYSERSGFHNAFMRIMEIDACLMMVSDGAEGEREAYVKPVSKMIQSERSICLKRLNLTILEASQLL